MGEGCNPHECPVGQRLEHQLEEFKRANSETHQKLWESINELKTNDAVQDSKYDTILSKLNEVTAEVKALQSDQDPDHDSWLSHRWLRAGQTRHILRKE